MSDYIITRDSSDCLKHYGIKGQKWGIRRFENSDGTLTEEGKKRYAKAQLKSANYKTAKERFKQIGKAGLIGAGVGAGFAIGAIGEHGSHLPVGDGEPRYGLVRTISRGLRSTGYGPEQIGFSAALGAIAGVTVSALKQGASAISVKRGQNFVNKYKSAFEKTYGVQNDLEG